MEKNYFYGTNIECQNQRIGVAFFLGNCAEVYGELVINGARKEVKILDCAGKQTFMPKKVLIEHITKVGMSMKKFSDICMKRLERQLVTRKTVFRRLA